MLKALRIMVFLLLSVAIGFFYGITYKKKSIPYVSFFSEGNIFNFLNSTQLKMQGDGVINVFFAKTTLTTSKTLSENNQADQKYTFMAMNNTSSTQQHSATTTAVSSSLHHIEILQGGDCIIFLETTNRTQLPSLVLCAIESAARKYKERPVVFFMKGLNDTNYEDVVKEYFPSFSSFNNVHFFPLRMEEVFTNTPLEAWYKKVTPEREAHWKHVSADGCRLALIWKYGGIYMDTDIISIRTIPYKNFLAGQSSQYSSNGVFGFTSNHNFTFNCMTDFAKNYNPGIWGNQGPNLFTRVLKQFCKLPDFKNVEDITCGNISFLNPQRFYPISYPAWRRYYDVWKTLPTFNDSYALHLWNYMNNGRRFMVPDSNTLVENLYKQHCPSLYSAIIRNQTSNL